MVSFNAPTPRYFWWSKQFHGEAIASDFRAVAFWTFDRVALVSEARRSGAWWRLPSWRFGCFWLFFHVLPSEGLIENSFLYTVVRATTRFTVLRSYDKAILQIGPHLITTDLVLDFTDVRCHKKAEFFPDLWRQGNHCGTRGESVKPKHFLCVVIHVMADNLHIVSKCIAPVK